MTFDEVEPFISVLIEGFSVEFDAQTDKYLGSFGYYFR